MRSTLFRRLALLGGLLFTLWAVWQVSKDETAPDLVARRASGVRRLPGAPAQPASAPALLWPQRPEPRPSIADVFSLPAPVLAAASAAVAAGPVGPVFHLKYVGRLDAGDNSHAFLADAQDHVVVVTVGQSVDGDWKLMTMDARQLVFRHTATGQEHSLQIGTPQ